MELLLFLVFFFFLGSWLTFLIGAAYHGLSIRGLPTGNGGDFGVMGAPKLSVIIAARDEEPQLRESLPVLLRSSYPNLEVILVNDRSNDGTGRVMEQYARSDARVTSITIDSLPDGWLGKVNALNLGTSLATGDWLLFTDADVHFSPLAFTKAIEAAESRSLDHVLVAPAMIVKQPSILLSVFNLAFGMMFVQSIKAASITKPNSRAFGGIGAFNLVRKEVFERSEGFEWLKMEVLDDVGVGLIMRRAGGKAAIFDGTGDVYLEWYPSLKETIKGLEKNSFAGFGRYNAVRAGLLITGMAAMILAPVVIAVVLQSWLLLAIFFALYALVPSVGAWIAKAPATAGPKNMLLLPIGVLLIAWTLLLSTLQALTSGGIFWRDSFYPIEALRQGQRVRL